MKIFLTINWVLLHKAFQYKILFIHPAQSRFCDNLLIRHKIVFYDPSLELDNKDGFDEQQMFFRADSNLQLMFCYFVVVVVLVAAAVSQTTKY